MRLCRIGSGKTHLLVKSLFDGIAAQGLSLSGLIKKLVLILIFGTTNATKSIQNTDWYGEAIDIECHPLEVFYENGSYNFERFDKEYVEYCYGLKRSKSTTNRLLNLLIDVKDLSMHFWKFYKISQAVSEGQLHGNWKYSRKSLDPRLPTACEIKEYKKYIIYYISNYTDYKVYNEIIFAMDSEFTEKDLFNKNNIDNLDVESFIRLSVYLFKRIIKACNRKILKKLEWIIKNNLMKDLEWINTVPRIKNNLIKNFEWINTVPRIKNYLDYHFEEVDVKSLYRIFIDDMIMPNIETYKQELESLKNPDYDTKKDKEYEKRRYECLIYRNEQVILRLESILNGQTTQRTQV